MGFTMGVVWVCETIDSLTEHTATCSVMLSNSEIKESYSKKCKSCCFPPRWRVTLPEKLVQRVTSEMLHQPHS